MVKSEMLKAARKWLCRSYYTQAEVSGFGDERVVLAMNRLYTGGWAQFGTDTETVELASQWELSW